MKKNYTFLSMLVAGCFLSAPLVSCGDDKDDNPVVHPDPQGEEVMTIENQKKYLDKVAEELMNTMKAEDFQALANLTNHIRYNYIDRSDWDDVGDWAKDCLDGLRRQVGVPSSDTQTSGSGNYVYITNTITTNYESLVFASNFCSRFTANGRKWTRTDADHLEFVFTDQSGQTCVLKLETSGKVVPVHMGSLEESDRSYSSSTTGNKTTYVTNRYYNETDYTIGVPEHIVVTLTQGGSEVVRSAVDINLASISGAEFDISRSSLNVSTETTLNNGYKITTKDITLAGNSKASVAFSLTKNGQMLVTMTLSGDMSGLPSYTVSSLVAEEASSSDFDNVNGRSVVAKVDVLGKVQVQGTISDVSKWVEYTDDAKSNRRNESTFKSYINQANSLTDINLYYNGYEQKQASVKLEPFASQTWNNETRWDAEAVMYFYDGSSYSTFEAFFNEKDFKSVIDHFKALADKYAGLVDENIYW